MNTPTLFSLRLKRVLSATVASSILLTTTLPGFANAGACDAYDANAGRSANCAARVIAGVPVAYPKFIWNQLAELTSLASVGGGPPSVQGGPQSVALANRTALALGLDSSEVAQLITMFPGNVPYVLARFNPVEGILRIDAFKLEKTTGAGVPIVRMLQTQFTPDHGDAWKASRAYISPSAFMAGNTPGLNPFTSFRGPGDGQFHNINLGSAQVAVGHAIRALGAGLGVVAVVETRLSTKTVTRRSVFKKTVKTWVYGHAKPRWLLAVPKDVLRQSPTANEAAFCASDVNSATCPLYATAASGVSFDEFSGGTLNSAEDTWEIDFMKQSGLTFIGALLLGGLASFAMAGILAAAGAAGAVAGVGAATATTAGTTMGLFGTVAVGAGGISAATMTLATAIAFEAAVIAGSMVLIGGANLSSMVKLNPGLMLGTVSVMKGVYETPSLTKYEAKINAKVKGLIEGPALPGSMLAGVTTTIFGSGCAAGSHAASCGSSGSVPRVDTYVESRQVEFMKDSNGTVLRSSPAL